MRRLQERQGQAIPSIDSAQSGAKRLLKIGVFSLLLHITLIIFLALNLKTIVTKTQSIYRVTLRPFSPPEGIQSASPGGGPGGTSTSQPPEQMKLDERSGGSKVEEKSKQDRKVEKTGKEKASPPAKKQKRDERLTKDEMRAGIKSPSEKEEKPKKKRDSNMSLQEALADIRKRAALDKIQEKVAYRERGEDRKAEEKSASSSRAGSSSGVGGGTGTGSGPGIGSGVGGYPIGGVPWGSPQGSSAWNSKLDDYYNMIWEKIKKEWTLPEDLPKGKTDLETVIIVIIERNGKIQKSWFEKKSGNALYDQMAMRAIKKAEPLPPIPKEFSEDTFEIGIRFHPD
jgi:TonB family protein